MLLSWKLGVDRSFKVEGDAAPADVDKGSSHSATADLQVGGGQCWQHVLSATVLMACISSALLLDKKHPMSTEFQPVVS
jgi:hypothetical protein